jgi:hypothetical protein
MTYTRTNLPFWADIQISNSTNNSIAQRRAVFSRIPSTVQVTNSSTTNLQIHFNQNRILREVILWIIYIYIVIYLKYTLWIGKPITVYGHTLVKLTGSQNSAVILARAVHKSSASLDMIYDIIWYDTITYDMIWYDMICDMIWYVIRYDIYDMIYDMICDMIWYVIWYDMTWYMIRYVIWYGMIWYTF